MISCVVAWVGFCIFLLASPLTSLAQWTPVVKDDFEPSRIVHEDLSLLTTWGNPPAVQSAFFHQQKEDRNGVRLPALSLTPLALQNSNFTTVSGLRTSTAIDYRIPMVNRLQDSVLIQLDALWDTLAAVGETARIVVALMHSVRSQPFPFGLIDSVNQAAPFGRPAYNFRMLNKATNTNRGGLYVFYGGGTSADGEVEFYNDTNTGSRWWLPGFIAQPGGTQPGTGGQYPIGPTYTNFSPLASRTNWQRISFLVAPEKLDIYLRNTSDSALPGYGSRIATMTIPRTDRGTAGVVSALNQGHGTNISSPPLLYNWFPTVNGVRIYYRASNHNSHVARVRVFVTQHGTLSLTKGRALPISPFPNPATDWLMVNPDLDGIAYELFDAQGRLVQAGQVRGGQVPVLTLPTGLYQIRLGGSVARVVKG